MILTLGAIAITSGTLYGGAKAYADHKKKKERPWTYALEKLNKRNNKANLVGINLSVVDRVKNVKKAEQQAVARRVISSSYDKACAEVRRIDTMLFNPEGEPSVFDKLLAPFLGKQREQLEQITGQKYEKSAEEKRMQRSLGVASLNMGIAGMSLLYPPLIWLAIPGVLYTWAPVCGLAYQGFKEGRVSSYVLDAMLLGGMLFGGYFYTTIASCFLQRFGRYLLESSRGRSNKYIKHLFSYQASTVFVVRGDGVEVEIPFEALLIDDIIVVSAGQMIPVDGIITAGSASIDQHKLTGESQLAEKGIGEEVFASTVVLAGRIHIQTKKTGQQTVAMQIGEILNRTADFKSSIQSRSEVMTDRLTLPTLGTSLLFFQLLGPSSGLAVLTNTFGYKMRLFGPTSMLSFLNIASQEGILVKDGRSLELLSEIDTIVFDKTGTLTLEVPTVSQIHSYHGVKASTVLKYAAAAEDGQSHPIAKAILATAEEQGIDWPKSLNARYEVGYGIQVDLPDRVIRVGSHKFMLMEGITISPEIDKVQKNCHQQGDSLVMVAFDEQLVGAIELQATIRPESKQIINELRQRNMSIVIISGDHEAPTKKLAQTLGVDDYFANTLPEHKAELVENLQEEGRSICFVGDGINDSIALKKAKVSVSLRGATTIATDSAQIVLMDGTLNQLCQMFDIVQDFEVNMKNNLLISTVPSATCIAGIAFLNWGVLTGMVITSAVQLAGVGNCIWPLLKYQRNKQATT
ncbi:MAG: heavy metal translocating P-type ATPase [Ardenticatenaceae bacterium]